MRKTRYRTKNKGILTFFKKRLHYKKQINRIICVLIILLLLLILKKMNNSISSKIIQIIHNGINYEFSVKKDGKIILDYGKKLLVLPDKALAVLKIKESHKYLPPIDGAICKPFGEVKYLDGSTTFNDGVDIIPKEQKEPVSIEEGCVKIIEDKKAKGYYVTIEHGNMNTVYGYLTKVYVKKGDKVAKGAKIGSLGTNKDGNKYLHFEIWVDDAPVNPLDYINFPRKL